MYVTDDDDGFEGGGAVSEGEKNGSLTLFTK